MKTAQEGFRVISQPSNMKRSACVCVCVCVCAGRGEEWRLWMGNVYVAVTVQWILAHLATTGPDHGQISEIAGYVNHLANRVYTSCIITSTAAFFLSCYPPSVQIIVIFRPLQASNGRNSGIFGCSNDLVQLLCSMCSMGIKNRMRRDWDRIIRPSSQILEVRISEGHCTTPKHTSYSYVYTLSLPTVGVGTGVVT